MSSTQHPYQRIAERIRTQIQDGILEEGQRLPSIKELSNSEGAATATVRSAYTWLAEEGYIRTSPRGTFVASDAPVAPTSYERLIRVKRTGSILSKGENKIVTDASLTVPPLYVSDLFDLDPGDQAVRRQFHVGKGKRRLALAVSWYPAQFAAMVPDLLSTNPSKCNNAVKLIQEATGREVTHGRDSMHGRPADKREASYLGLPVGASILAMVHEWSDVDGIIEYSEWCLPPSVTIGYEYALQAMPTD